MKRGDRVNIDEYGMISSHRSWGKDQFSGIITLKPGDIIYHSSDKQLKKFVGGWTCFYVNDYIKTGYVYAIKITKEMKVRSWNAKEEVRIDLDNSHKITYIGKCTVKYDYEKKGCIGNPYVAIKDNTLKEWRK